MIRRALVLGAGGPAAESWSTGVIAGLADAGIDVRDADLLVGTSAGATVALAMTSGLSTETLFARHIEPLAKASSNGARVDFAGLMRDITRAKRGSDDLREKLRRVGSIALRSAAGTAAQHRALVEARLPVQTWPATRVLCVAVDVDRGERRAFERATGEDVIDAVAASGAPPGVWPPVKIAGRRFMDGAIYSTANGDLAKGYDRVLILELPPGDPPFALVAPEVGIDVLRGAGSHVEVVNPDEATLRAFRSVGGNLLDPTVREQAALAGRAQARGAVAARVAALWYATR